MNRLLVTVTRIRLFIDKHKTLAAFITGILTWILIQAVAGIVGNSAFDYWISRFLPWLIVRSPLNNFAVIAIGFLCLLTGLLYQVINTRFNRHLPIVEHSMLTSPLRSQEISDYYLLLGSLHNLIQSGLDRIANERELDALVWEYFLKIFLYLGKDKVNGGGILIPEKSNPDWLHFWKMDASQVMSPKRFYIGIDTNLTDDNRPRGVAGWVYLRDQARIVNILNRASADADVSDYHKFNMSQLEQPRLEIPYGSFICLPVHRNGKVVGVLTLESREQHSFDAYSMEYLQPIADQLGIALYISDKIRGDLEKTVTE